MGKKTTFLVVLLMMVVGNEGFYVKKQFSSMATVTPKNLKELVSALAGDSPRKVVIKGLFDFTGKEGYVTETGCYYKSKPKECLTAGQKMLNSQSQCSGRTATSVTYSKAGVLGITVGSNKVIVGENNGWLKGKGLRLLKSQNVEIHNLKITDINADVVWGGDAIFLSNVNNVLIDNCYFKNIGRQMLVTNWNAASVGVTVSNCVFDGKSATSGDCKGNHYWLWLFMGPGDRITLQHNVITATSGRGPKLAAFYDKKSLLHIIQNVFYNVAGSLLNLSDKKSSVLIEGNTFVNVKRVVITNLGNIFMVQNANDAKACMSFLGRLCLQNSMVSSKTLKISNSQTALQDFKAVSKYMVKPINMKSSSFNYISVPDNVKKYYI